MGRVAFALDVKDINIGKQILNEMEGLPIIIKVGYVLFIQGGYKFIEFIKKLGFEIFLDLKLHDIPNTVYNGVEAASNLGVNYLTIHSLGGKEMMLKAVEGRKNHLKILAVTILTSHSDDYLKYIGSKYTVDQLTLKLSKSAIDCGVDGIVSSAYEVKKLKTEIKKKFLAVTPGIRFLEDKNEDQKRVATPKMAVSNGADIIVVGRSILNSKNRRETVERILNEIKEVKYEFDRSYP